MPKPVSSSALPKRWRCSVKSPVEFAKGGIFWRERSPFIADRVSVVSVECESAERWLVTYGTLHMPEESRDLARAVLGLPRPLTREEMIKGFAKLRLGSLTNCRVLVDRGPRTDLIPLPGEDWHGVFMYRTIRPNTILQNFVIREFVRQL